MIEEHLNQGQQTNSMMLMQDLIRCVMQEKLSPDLLNYQTSLINQLKKMIKMQEERLQQFSDKTDISSPDKNFKYSIYKLDIQRMSYLIKNYLRTRLIKIQKYAFYILKDNAIAKLSSEQQQFVVGYAKLRYDVYDQNVLKLKDLHKDFKNLGGMEAYFDPSNSSAKKQTPSKQSQVDFETPNKQAYVFYKILENPHELRYQLDVIVQNLTPDQRDIISEGDIILMPYNLGEQLLVKNHVTLL